MRLLLDTCILTELCNPKGDPKLANWFIVFTAENLIDDEIVIPEIADYELRRGLLYRAHYHPDLAQRKSFLARIGRLDSLKANYEFLALTESSMQRAAGLWAQAKGSGRRTAPESALDGDVILASQALEDGSQVVTHNRKHLAVYSVPIFPLGRYLKF